MAIPKPRHSALHEDPSSCVKPYAITSRPAHAFITLISVRDRSLGTPLGSKVVREQVRVRSAFCVMDLRVTLLDSRISKGWLNVGLARGEEVLHRPKLPYGVPSPYIISLLSTTALALVGTPTMRGLRT